LLSKLCAQLPVTQPIMMMIWLGILLPSQDEFVFLLCLQHVSAPTWSKL
jgi:hypothetical protein